MHVSLQIFFYFFLHSCFFFAYRLCIMQTFSTDNIDSFKSPTISQCKNLVNKIFQDINLSPFRLPSSNAKGSHTDRLLLFLLTFWPWERSKLKVKVKQCRALAGVTISKKCIIKQKKKQRIWHMSHKTKFYENEYNKMLRKFNDLLASFRGLSETSLLQLYHITLSVTFHLSHGEKHKSKMTYFTVYIIKY